MVGYRKNIKSRVHFFTGVLRSLYSLAMMVFLFSPLSISAYSSYETAEPPAAPANLTETETTMVNPRFSWIFRDPNTGDYQSAYRILVSRNTDDLTNDAATLWDSTKTNGGDASGIRYEGSLLDPGTVAYWKVKTWDAQGNESPWSTPSDLVISTFAVPTDRAAPSVPTSLARTSREPTDTTPTFSWDVSRDNIGVTSYSIIVGSHVYNDIGLVTTFTVPLTDALPYGPSIVEVRARDAAGNTSAPATFQFTVSEPPRRTEEVEAPLFATGLAAGDIVKLPDDGNPETSFDSTLYYLNTNGKRYVFPHSKIYLSWYADFKNVKVAAPAHLANIPLGGTVRYRPGVRMVKLQSDPTVYVVARGGRLHKIPSEEIARALYGQNWNQFIDDLNDAFWNRYTLSSQLLSAQDFSPSVQLNLAPTINIDLQN